MPRAPAPISSNDRASSSALVRHTTELSSDEYLGASKHVWSHGLKAELADQAQTELRALRLGGNGCM